jgi:hypothetical protein
VKLQVEAQAQAAVKNGLGDLFGTDGAMNRGEIDQ